mmetsp:Transcript_6132/g.13436  ORF Transcript_6132/g.13436 Transcript_6132/m.13436 type:complete len:353 (-) Transcript_6132:11-1069(-)
MNSSGPANAFEAYQQEVAIAAAEERVSLAEARVASMAKKLAPRKKELVDARNYLDRLLVSVESMTKDLASYKQELSDARKNLESLIIGNVDANAVSHSSAVSVGDRGTNAEVVDGLVGKRAALEEGTDNNPNCVATDEGDANTESNNYIQSFGQSLGNNNDEAAQTSTLSQASQTRKHKLQHDENDTISAPPPKRKRVAIAPRRPRRKIRLVRQFKHPDGIDRHVPPSWTFPSLPLQSMYLYWHCGDEEQQIPPIKYFEPIDVDFLCKRARTNLNECRRVMEAINKGSEISGLAPQEEMTRPMTNACYLLGEPAILELVPKETPCNRVRNVSNLRWGTVVKYHLRTKRREGN